MWRLDRCLFSLLGQRHSPIEPILCLQALQARDLALVDEVLDQFLWGEGCARPKVVNVESAKGVDVRSKLLNVGIEAATGRYLTFLDFDDYWYANALSYLSERIRTTGAAIVFARILRVRSFPFGFYDYGCEKTQPFKGNSIQDLLQDNFCPIHSYMLDTTRISRSDLCFDESLQVLEDYEFLLRIVAKYASDFDGIDKVVGEYLWRSDGSNTTPVGAGEDDERHNTWAAARQRMEELKERLAGNRTDSAR
jgi:hypothetical protein